MMGITRSAVTRVATKSTDAECRLPAIAEATMKFQAETLVSRPKPRRAIPKGAVSGPVTIIMMSPLPLNRRVIRLSGRTDPKPQSEEYGKSSRTSARFDRLHRLLPEFESDR